MERTERIALLHGLFSRNRYGLSNEQLMKAAQCSRATLYRDLGFMREVLAAPLEHEGDPARIWRYVSADARAFELPGIWLSADELYALMLANEVLQRSDGGLLGQALGPLQPRVHKLLGDKARRLDRLRVLRTQARRVHPNTFRLVTEALLDGRQLRFAYHSRSSGQDSEREVSPQRITHHRDNWYLDAWDPTHQSLRRYALDRIRRPQLLPAAALDIPLSELDTRQEAGYGIFAGQVAGTAVIKFSPHAARWIADEVWHPKQRQRLLPDASLELTIPYANPRELLMDVQRYGADAEVLSPPELRAELRTILAAALARYDEPASRREPGTRGADAARHRARPSVVCAAPVHRAGGCGVERIGDRT